MFKEFFFKKLIEKQLGSLSEDQKTRALAALESNPDFFAQLVDEIKTETDNGVNQMEAVRLVAMRHQEQLVRMLKEGGIVK